MGKKQKGIQGKEKKHMKDINKKVDDKTFGMKNKKKSKRVQNMVKNLANTELGGYEKMRNKIYEEQKKKKLKEQERKLLGDVFAKVLPKNQNGPKLCPFFQAGLCNKGKKCKLAHIKEKDLKTQQQFNEQDNKKLIENEKIDLYTDQREILFGNKDIIDNWDTKKLKEVVDYNSNKYLNQVKTEKICKHFLDAVERKVYGWLWMCPNGHECVFKHCLPPNYVFKNQQKNVITKKKNDDNQIVQNIDEERNNLSSDKLTQITKELFDEWLIKRKKRKQEERKKKIEQQLQDLGIKKSSKLTGKQLFEKKQDLFQDAEDAVDQYERDDNVEINEDIFEDEELPDL